MSNPSNFGGKTFDVCFLLVENFFRNEHGERTVLHPYTLDLFVEPLLYFFPDKVRRRLSVVSDELWQAKMRCLPSEYSSQRRHNSPAYHPW